MDKEKIAAKITEIYIKEIIRSGQKRKLDLDAIINAYTYTFEKLNA